MTEYDKAMRDWYVDKGLGTLIAQEKQLHPGLVVGTIAGMPEEDGSVDAGDFMLGQHFSKSDANVMSQTLVKHRDRRFGYMIWNRRIISATVQPWVWRPYTGKDPHTGHIHLTVNDKHENDNSPWNLGGKAYKYTELKGYGLPVLKYGMDDTDFNGYNAVGRAQSLLNYLGAKLTVDGNYGPATMAAVKRELGGDGKVIDIPDWVRLAGLSRSV
jgi:hypothetical protein